MTLPLPMSGMWSDLVRALEPAATFGDAAAPDRLSDARLALGAPLPEPLISLLSETDGIRGASGLGLVWNLEEIVATNTEFRRSEAFAELYMPFEPLLFIGDAGNGDQFALLCPPVERDDVFVWNHEDDSRTWVAPDLRHYLEWWLTGRIQL